MRFFESVWDTVAVIFLSLLAAGGFLYSLLFLRATFFPTFQIPHMYLFGGGGLLAFLFAWQAKQRNEPIRSALYYVIVSILVFALVLMLPFFASYFLPPGVIH